MNSTNNAYAYSPSATVTSANEAEQVRERLKLSREDARKVAEKLRDYREDLETRPTTDETSARTSPLGRRE